MRLVPLSLLALCLALAAVLIDKIAHPIKAAYPSEAAPAAPKEIAAEPRSVTTPPRAEFAEIATRPLFVVARRPPPPPSAPMAVPAPPPAPPSPPTPASNITVVGIIADQDKRVALLQPPNSSTILYLVEGESISGWKVRRILNDRVVLRWESTEQEITFPKQVGRSSGSAPAGIRGSLPMRPSAVPRPPR